MPLNKKGKKILASMEKRYGKKKGKTVFYAMENSGKLKGIKASKGLMVKKYAGGGMDASKPDFKISSPSPGDTGGAGGFDKSTQQVGNKGPTTTFKDQLKTAINDIGNATRQMSVLPLTPFGAAVTGMTTIENARRAKRAKGEYFLSTKKIDPINREFYRATQRPLDTKIGSPDEPYMKSAGIIGFPQPNTMRTDKPNTTMCPDGTFPPCKSPETQIKNPVSTTNPFLTGFQSYDDGGEIVISSNVNKDLL